MKADRIGGVSNKIRVSLDKAGGGLKIPRIAAASKQFQILLPGTSSVGKRSYTPVPAFHENRSRAFACTGHAFQPR